MTPRLAHRFPAAWLCELAPLRQAFDDWWDKAGIDALARPPMVVKLVRRSNQDLHETALRLALTPLAHVALRRATRRAAGVCLIYDQDAASTAGNEEVEVELLEGRP